MSVIGGNFESSTVSVSSQVHDVTMPGTKTVNSHSTATQAFTLPASVQFNVNFPILVCASDSTQTLQGQQSWDGSGALNGTSIQDVTVSGSTLTVTFSNPTGGNLTIPAGCRLTFVQIQGS